jgi:hypothetical protein
LLAGEIVEVEAGGGGHGQRRATLPR